MTHKNGEERVVGLVLKINGVRVQRLTHIICEERVDGSIVETDGVRVQRFTHNNNNNNISEERADGFTLWLVDGDGSWCALDCVRCRKTSHSSFVEIGNEVHMRDDGLEEIEWLCRWHQWSRVGRCWWFLWLQWLRWRRRYCGWSGGVDAVDGVEWWRRMVASNGGVDGFDGWHRRWWLGSSTQRALTWKSLCVPSGEFGMHSGSLLPVLNSCLRIAVLATCRICFSCSTVCLLPDVCLHSFFCLVMVVYIMTVILTAVLWCL